MSKDQIEPLEELESIETGAPSLARRAVARIFQSATDSDVGLFCKCGVGEDGKYYTTIEAVGIETEVEALGSTESGRPSEDPGWDPQNPPKKSIGKFRAIDHGQEGDESGRGISSVVGELWRPLDVRHEASCLLYDGSVFLGWLGVFRRGDRPYKDAELERLNGMVDRAIQVLSDAESVERELLGDRPAKLLLDPETLDVRSHTENGAEWLNEQRADKLTESVESLTDDEPLPTKFNVEGFRVWLDEMSGEGGRRYLATVEYPERPELSLEALLTPRQREVVGYAAAGATNNEIAETLGISPDTVSDHLSASYRRLGVANRVELARKVAESG